MRRLLFTALMVAIPLSAVAQHNSLPLPFVGGRASSPVAHFAHHRFFRPGYAPVGFFDPYYSDYFPEISYPTVSQPPVIVVQPPPPSPAPEVSATPSQPLMIELQGDRYVQVSGDQPLQSQMIDSSSTTRSLARSAPPVELTSPRAKSSTALLIFRDGHREEVSAYTIADGALYASADYATTGSWNRRIELSSLDLPETIAANKSLGQPFQLPSAPNEVVVGP